MLVVVVASMGLETLEHRPVVVVASMGLETLAA